MPGCSLRAVANAPLEALLGKYARGITIDMDAMEEQIREAESIDPDSMASAVNITKVAFPDTPEQKQAMKAWRICLPWWRAGWMPSCGVRAWRIFRISNSFVRCCAANAPSEALRNARSKPDGHAIAPQAHA